MASKSILLNTEQNKSIYLCDEMFYIHCWLQIKQKSILNRHISCSCSDPIYRKSIKKKAKSLFFDRIPFLYQLTISECKDVSHVSSDHKIYLQKEKLVPNRKLVKL